MGIEFLGGTRSGPGGQPLPFSPAVKAGPFVFVSGQVALGDNGELVPGGIEAQTRQVVQAHRAGPGAGRLHAGRTSPRSSVWLDDARDFWQLQPGLHGMPGRTIVRRARSTTQAKLMIDAKVEIEVVAYRA